MIKNIQMISIRNAAWAVSCSLLIISCSADKNPEATKPGFSPDTTEKIIPVSVQEIIKQTIPRTLDYTANLIAFREINFAPASPGRIESIDVEVGTRVRKGQVLVEMDKTQLTQALTQYENVKTNFQRIDTLYQLGSASEQQYEQLKTQYEIAKSNYEFLLENTTLESPINGIVTGKYFEGGELYSGVPNTQAGKAAILTLMQINPLKAVISISQSHYPDVKEGMKAEISTDIFQGKTFRGTVYKVYPTIDASTRTFKTEIIVDNPSEILRPGMFADIHVKLSDAEALVVPSIAVLKQEGTNIRYVFLSEEGTAKRIDVTMGKRFDDLIEISGDGLVEGADLIVEGQGNLLDGSRIRIVK